MFTSTNAKIQELADLTGVSYSVAEAYIEYRRKFERRQRMGGRTAYRDSTREKTYMSESRFRRLCGNGGSLTVDEAKKIAEKVFNSASWKKHEIQLYSSKTVPVIEFTDKNTSYAGIAYHNRIVLASCGRNLFILLHELAHTNGHRHHDVSFRKCLVDFVAEFMSKDAAKKLKTCFSDAGLKMQVRIANGPKSFTKWHETYLRMENARAMRGF